MSAADTGIMKQNRRKRRPETSFKKKNSLFELPAHTATSEHRPSSFPEVGTNTEACSALPSLQIGGGRNRELRPFVAPSPQPRLQQPLALLESCMHLEPCCDYQQ
ncbi:hypothetical protein XENORESO_017334 [Xenotaenia resolanae]|uniref:Uncharacterized protein n=1 Tax=Xenotaenia resolanae TaxID=208358 RepID=A0ABV0WGG6_9TELE